MKRKKKWQIFLFTEFTHIQIECTHSLKTHSQRDDDAFQTTISVQINISRYRARARTNHKKGTLYVMRVNAALRFCLCMCLKWLLDGVNFSFRIGRMVASITAFSTIDILLFESMHAHIRSSLSHTPSLSISFESGFCTTACENLNFCVD